MRIETLSRILRLGAAVVVCWVIGFVIFALVWSTTYPDLAAVPVGDEPRVAAKLLGDITSGWLACVLLPLLSSRRRERTWGPAAVVIVLTLAVSSWGASAAILALVVVAARRNVRWIVAVTVAGFAGAVVSGLLDPPFDPLVLVVAAVVIAVPTLLGLYLGSRRALMASYREQAESARREQDANVAMARAQERTAIAREMHDTLSHRLSLISLHAGALAFRPDMDPERRAEGARLIQSTAQNAAEELHTLLTMLRTDVHDTGLDTDVAQVEAICEEFRSQGVDVSLVGEADLPARLSTLSALRSRALAQTVREGLANAAKHAPGEPVTVDVAEVDDGVQVRVENALTAPRHAGLAGGYGLVGVEERLAVAGGRIRTGTHDGRFVLEAWVPWT